MTTKRTQRLILRTALGVAKLRPDRPGATHLAKACWEVARMFGWVP